MIVRKTLPEESQRVNELFAICFEQSYGNCPIDPENDHAAHWAAFHDDGEMMSTLTISDFAIHFDGHCCPMGGVGGVATLPEFRRRGGIRACFEAALPDLYTLGYDFSYLYPFSTTYYRKFGYECCVQKFEWAVNLGLLNPPKADGTFCLAEKHRPLTDAIRAVDTIWEQCFNMMVQHCDEHYQWTNDPEPAVTQEFTYVWFDAENTPKGYTTFRLANEHEGRNLVCSRFCFVDKEGFAGLMQLFKSLSSDHTYVKFQTPALLALQYLLPEWSLGAVKWSLLPNGGMVRVINVQNVLKKARYLGSGRCTLEIKDPQISENTGRFTVTFADGKAQSVDRTCEDADATMPVATFSALISGVCDWSEAKHTFSSLEIHRDGGLAQMFYRKPLMICDYF